MMKKRIFTPKVLIPFLVALLLLTAARLGLPRFLGTAQATTGQPFALVPQAQTVPTDTLPPVLVTTTPAEGESWSGGAITFTFDQPLDPGSIVAFGVAPELAGAATVSGTALIFTPAVPPTGGERYTFTLDADAKGVNGVALGSPVELTLVAQSPLMVTSTQPSDGTTDVDTDSQIVVVFNRPVVELVGVAEQASLPQPLTIEPAVEGEGSWLNTSIYRFQPTLGLAGATDYTVTVSDLTARDGSTLAEPVVFRFSTAAPIVTDVQPNMSPVAPESAFRITFSQPMDPASTEAAITLTNKEDSTAVAGESAWDEAQTTLTFTPTQQLAFGGNYTLRVDASAQPASQQGNLREPYENSFTVVPLPAVDMVAPSSGATTADPEMSVTIRFNTPMSRTQVLPYISITPTLTTTQVYSYYREYDNTAELSWFKDAQTTYTVTVGAEAMDLYGNTLGEPYRFSFTTGDYSAFARLDVERFTHFSAYTETRVSTIYRNIDALEARLYQLPLKELFRLSGENQYEIWRNYTVPDPESNLIWERTYAPRTGLNVAAQQVISLTNANDELLAPGVYFLALDYPDRDPEVEIDQNVTPMQAVIILSNNNVIMKKSSQGNSLAWVTDLQSGQPIADLPVRFYHGGELKGETTTGADGTALADLALDPMTGWYAALAVVGEPGDANFGVASSDWSQGIAPWDFNINGGYGVEEYRNYFYTDRPIYRPGQTVYWKGIIRRMVNDQYELPAASLPISITVRDDQGNAILEDTYTLNANGIVSDAVTLAPEAVTGYYYLEARIILGPEQMTYGGVGFQVAAYRKPEFEIAVTSDQPEYTNGDTATFGLQASYFSGGPLANAPVTWRLLSEPYTFNWADAPAGALGARYFSFTPYDPENTDYDPYRSAFYAGLIQEGTGTTDAQGNFSVDLPVDLQDLLQSQQWSFDVTVQSSTNQFVSGRTSVPVHKGEFYIGLSPRSYVATVDDESTVDVVTITPQGEAYPGVELEAIVYEFKWNSVYEQGANGAYNWQTSVERTPVFTTTLTTDRDGMAPLTWTPERGGQYQVVASGEDDAGNQISSAVFVWVSSESFVPWRRENNDRIELVADKQSYAPGETAQILIPSPFTATVQALVTIERGGVLAEQVITLDGNSETLPVSITVEHIPDIFVSVILVKGVDASNPTPAMRIGYVQLNVETAAKTLEVTVEPSATTVMPGDTVTYTLTVADHEGNPVPNAEVSVAVVDKAVLSLATDFNQSLLDFFYYLRPLGVSTGAALNINRDRLSQQLSEGAKGGGGGGGPGLVDLREEFPDIAFWRAAFVSDENGQITFSVDLPDNLTTWRLAAKAITADTLVGEAVNDVVATKALQIRPLLPRFFTAGDRSQIGAVVVNAGELAMEAGQLTIAVEGATLDDDATAQSFTLDAGAQTRFDWPLTVGSETDVVTFTFSAESTVDSDPATLTDAVRLAIPVRRYETPEVVGTSGTVPAAGVTEAVRVPAAATANGDLQVTVEPSLAAGMIDGLEYLAHFPYECNEQTVSRFLPNLFTVRALNTLGIANPELERQLNYGLGVGVQRLVSRQNGDGGWGYWPTEESSPFITAYVLWGLVNAQGMDYTVPERTIANAVDYLDRQFKAPKDVPQDTEGNWLLNELAFMNFVLSEVGEGDPGRASTLYDARERLGLYGQALLAMTLDNLGENDDRVSTLLDNLYGAAQLSATGASWHEAEQDWWTLNTDVRTTAMVVAAFVRLQPDEPILPQAVRWLMSAREAGRWATTQENAWSIIALTDWMSATGELEGDYDWAVTLNGEEAASGMVRAENIDNQSGLRIAIADLLRDAANELRLTRTNESGELYYTTHLRYYLDALAIDARDRGIVVDRRFELDDATVQSAAVGDVISVTVTLVAPTDLYQALVEVPIPAGTEPIDPRLATTSVQYDQFGQLIPADAGKPSWWWTPTSVDVRDDRVALAATYLPAGTYEYTFQVQATVPGEYRVLPVTGQMLYFPEVWGRSAGALFTVTQ